MNIFKPFIFIFFFELVFATFNFSFPKNNLPDFPAKRNQFQSIILDEKSIKRNSRVLLSSTSASSGSYLGVSSTTYDPISLTILNNTILEVFDPKTANFKNIWDTLIWNYDLSTQFGVSGYCKADSSSGSGFIIVCIYYSMYFIPFAVNTVFKPTITVVDPLLVGNKVSPNVLCINNGSFILSWLSNYSNNIVAQFYSSAYQSTTTVFKVFTVNNSTFAQAPKMKLLTNGLIFLACWTISQEVYTALIANNGSIIVAQQKFSQITSAVGITLEILKNGNIILAWLTLDDPISPYATYYYVILDNNGTQNQNMQPMGSNISYYTTKSYSLLSTWPVSITPVADGAFFALKEFSSDDINPTSYPGSVCGIIESFGITPEYKNIYCDTQLKRPFGLQALYITGAHMLHIYINEGYNGASIKYYKFVINLPVFLINNNLTIEAGVKLTLNTSMIYAIGNGTLNYSILNYQNCHFELSTAPNIAINSFLDSQLSNGTVILVPDGSTNTPFFSIKVTDKRINSYTFNSTITFIFHVYPAVTINQFTVKETENITISPSNINGNSKIINFVYTIKNLLGGIFKVNGVTSNTFTQAQLNSSLVIFIVSDPHPDYDLYVSDTINTSVVSKPNITYIPFPKIFANNMTIKQGSSYQLSSSNITGTGAAGVILTFSIITNIHISFMVNSAVVTTFTMSQILAKQVSVTHDGTIYAPSCTIMLSDGTDSVTVSLNITFKPLTVIKPVQIYIKQGKSCLITPYMIDGNVDPLLVLTFYISNLKNAFFYYVSNPKKQILSFTKTEIASKLVQFQQDGTNNVPTFNIYASDGNEQTKTLRGLVTLIQLPRILSNNFTIKQGTSVVVSNNNINGFVGESLFLTFFVSNLSHCHFEFYENPGTAITSFKMYNIINKQLIFVHDGTYSAPSYTLNVSDGTDNATGNGNITFLSSPVLVNKQFTISQGATIKLSSTQILASASGITDMSLIVFFASQITHGYFQYRNKKNVPITQFTQSDIALQLVEFVHDDSLLAPTSQITVQVGDFITTAQNLAINFIPNLNLTANKFSLDNGKNLTLSSLNLDAKSSHLNCFLKFTIISPQNCKFVSSSNPSISINYFYKSQIALGQIILISDGKNMPPSFKISVSDGFYTLPSFNALVLFGGTPFPVLINNKLFITQGESKTLTTDDLMASDGTLSTMIFSVNSTSHGHFENILNPGIDITTFDSNLISNGNIQFVHDGGKLAPTYSINFQSSALNAKKTINYNYFASITFNLIPILINNIITVNKGEKVLITSEILSATDVDSPIASITFFVSNCDFGYFALVTSQNVPLTSFTQNQINNQEIYFFHDNSVNAPSYQVAVNDGMVTIPKSWASVTFLIKKGFADMVLSSSVADPLMMSISKTVDNGYLVASLAKGSVYIYTTLNEAKPILFSGLNLNSYGIFNLNRLVVQNCTVFIASDDNTLVIVSIEDILNPYLMGAVADNKIRTIKDLIVVDNYTYLAGGLDGILIVDVENCSTPVLNSTFNLGCSVASMVNNGKFLYVVCENDMFLRVMDNSVKTNPNLINLVNVTDYAHHVILIHGNFYLNMATKSGFVVMSLLDPANPSLLHSQFLEELFYLAVPSSSNDSSNALIIQAIANKNFYIINSEAHSPIDYK